MDTSTLTNQIPDWTEVDFENITNITVVYCRLSQEDSRASESDSIQNQKKYLGNFVQEENLQNPNIHNLF